jgi:hypothetical protein
MSGKNEPPKKSPVEVLEEIRDILQASRPVDVPSDFCFERYFTVPPSSTVDGSIKLPTPGAYIHLTTTDGTPLPKTTVANQNGSILMTIPEGTNAAQFSVGSFVDLYLTFTRTAGTSNQFVVVWVSSRPFSLAIL